MRNVEPKETMPSPEIWKWVWDTLEEISDEIGVEGNGEYLLAYEGWGGFCVNKIFDSTKSDEENEDSYYKFAEEESDKVIVEWLLKYKDRYYLVDCGHEPIGLYGVTWALFKTFNDRLSKPGYPFNEVEFSNAY